MIDHFVQRDDFIDVVTGGDSASVIGGVDVEDAVQNAGGEIERALALDSAEDLLRGAEDVRAPAGHAGFGVRMNGIPADPESG